MKVCCTDSFLLLYCQCFVTVDLICITAYIAMHFQLKYTDILDSIHLCNLSSPAQNLWSFRFRIVTAPEPPKGSAFSRNCAFPQLSRLKKKMNYGDKNNNKQQHEKKKQSKDLLHLYLPQKSDVVELQGGRGFHVDETVGDKGSKGRCDPEFLFYEFTSNEAAHVVKKRFQRVKVVFNFKVYGVGQYFFVVKNDQSKNLRNLVLPDDVLETVSTFPLETFSNFLDRLDIRDLQNETLNPLTSDKDLTFMETIWDAHGLNEEQFRALMAEQVRQFSVTDTQFPRALFVAAANLPTKFICFWNLDDCSSAQFIQLSDPLGGPGSTSTRLLKLHNF